MDSNTNNNTGGEDSFKGRLLDVFSAGGQDEIIDVDHPLVAKLHHDSTSVTTHPFYAFGEAQNQIDPSLPMYEQYGTLEKYDLDITGLSDREKLQNSMAKSSNFYLNNDWTLEKNLPLQKELKERLEIERKLKQKREFWFSFSVGSFLSCLLNVVYCITVASSVRRNRCQNAQMLLPLAKMSALGIIVSTPVLLSALPDMPALYPAVDLFVAPFLSDMADVVDKAVYNANLESGHCSEEGYYLFLNTFAVLVATATLLSSLLSYLAARFKLANLGAFLPYPSLCGFFSAIGILVWWLAFKIDRGGPTTNLTEALIHHIPSVAGGICIQIFKGRGPFIIPVIFFTMIACVYLFMMIIGSSLEDAQNASWFWSSKNLQFYHQSKNHSFIQAVPSLFGFITSIFQGNVMFAAVFDGLPNAFAMGLIYMVRNSLHAAALRKNAVRLLRKVHPGDKGEFNRVRLMSDYDEEDWPLLNTDGKDTLLTSEEPVDTVKEPPPSVFILLQYSINHFWVGIAGGLPTSPNISASSTLFNVGAGGPYPQIGSAVLMFMFYWTNFHLAAFIPKFALSSLLINSSIDMLSFWLVQSYQKMNSKWEWTVVPVIIVLTFLIGMLQAVAFGVACSTFIFVAAFYRSGVVKFSANGKMIRSTIERGFESEQWLNDNGDLIQVIVLKNYLFFGNASSIVRFIEPWFSLAAVATLNDVKVGCSPVHIIIDFSLVSGVDASAVEIFVEIIALCVSNKCRVSFSAMSNDVRAVLTAGGVQKVPNQLSYYRTLEAALGNAEDLILSQLSKIEDKERNRTRRRQRLLSNGSRRDDGFLYALRQIDEQHDLDFEAHLRALKPFISCVTLSPGQKLFSSSMDQDGVIDQSDRGLFFIEHGVMKVEQDPFHHFAKRKRRRSFGPLLKKISFKSVNPARDSVDETLKENYTPKTKHSLRLARIGPGWVVGTVEGLTGMKNPGVHIAVTSCRLHHLSYDSMTEIENENPKVAIQLLKMLAYLMSKRQEGTIQQLNRFHSIMTSDI